MSVKHKAKGKNYRARNKNDHSDYFPTFWALTRLLLEKRVFGKDDLFLEPCAGAGDITKVLNENGYDNVFEIDINPRREGIKKLDFLESKDIAPVSHIITNPPFKMSVEFMCKCAEVATDTIIMLWPLDYLHGVERFTKFYDQGVNGFHLSVVYPFVRRPLFDAKYHPGGKMPTGATSFAWFEFQKMSYSKPPIIEWIHNNDEMGQPTMADELLLWEGE